MHNEARIRLLHRAVNAASARTPAQATERSVSVLLLAAASYGSRPSGDATIPTGFDPVAVALFEAIVEGAYLVANADGVFDEVERKQFERVVLAACGGTVAPHQLAVLVAELSTKLHDDGMPSRVQAVADAVERAATATQNDHGRAILRIAALLSLATDSVSAEERAVLEALARACGLQPDEVEAALVDVRDAIAAAQRPSAGALA